MRRWLITGVLAVVCAACAVSEPSAITATTPSTEAPTPGATDMTTTMVVAAPGRDAELSGEEVCDIVYEIDVAVILDTDVSDVRPNPAHSQCTLTTQAGVVSLRFLVSTDFPSMTADDAFDEEVARVARRHFEAVTDLRIGDESALIHHPEESQYVIVRTGGTVFEVQTPWLAFENDEPTALAEALLDTIGR